MIHQMDYFYVYYLLLEFLTYSAIIKPYTTKRRTVKLNFGLKTKPISLTAGEDRRIVLIFLPILCKISLLHEELYKFF